MPEYFDDSGNVTEAFRTDLPTMLGTEHAESKMFDDIIGREDKSEASDIALMIKSGADTKAMVGKRQENVIHKPGDDASDDDKAEFTKALLTHLGTAEKAEDFEFAKPTDLPEGMSYSEDDEKEYRQWCLDNNVPKGMAKLYFDKFNAMQLDIFTKGQEAAQEAIAEKEAKWQADCDDFSDKHPGVELGKALRVALKAIEMFNQRNPELLAELKKSELYTHPENFKAWKDAGIDVPGLWQWEEVGKAMLDGTFERGNTPKDGDSDETKQMKGMYNHPTSAKLFPK